MQLLHRLTCNFKDYAKEFYKCLLIYLRGVSVYSNAPKRKNCKS